MHAALCDLRHGITGNRSRYKPIRFGGACTAAVVAIYEP